jgi:hypothetical protein
VGSSKLPGSLLPGSQPDLVNSCRLHAAPSSPDWNCSGSRADPDAAAAEPSGGHVRNHRHRVLLHHTAEEGPVSGGGGRGLSSNIGNRGARRAVPSTGGGPPLGSARVGSSNPAFNGPASGSSGDEEDVAGCVEVGAAAGGQRPTPRPPRMSAGEPSGLPLLCSLSGGSLSIGRVPVWPELEPSGGLPLANSSSSSQASAQLTLFFLLQILASSFKNFYN